jgi:hypothetical protein
MPKHGEFELLLRLLALRRPCQTHGDRQRWHGRGRKSTVADDRRVWVDPQARLTPCHAALPGSSDAGRYT